MRRVNIKIDAGVFGEIEVVANYTTIDEEPRTIYHPGCKAKIFIQSLHHPFDGAFIGYEIKDEQAAQPRHVAGL